MPDMSRANFFHKLWQLASFLFLTLVCVGQGYQSAHLHHVHTNDSVTFAVSVHPLVPESDHDQNHQHHEDDSSHENKNEHNYKKKIDWNVARSKSTTDINFDLLTEVVPAYTLRHIVFDKTYPITQTLSYKKKRYTAFLIIRGPPQLA